MKASFSVNNRTPKTSLPVYLDGHATTPLAPEAAVAMAPWWHELAANAHSPHASGQRAAVAVEGARSYVAALIGADVSEIIFTSGATEANAIALIGTARAAVRAGDTRRELVVSAIEHKSVLETVARLELDGFQVLIAPVSESGVVDLNVLQRLVTSRTLMVSIMAANNEVGVIQPLEAIAGIVRRSGAMLHVDGSQQVGKASIDANLADFVSLSSHKMYGPVGVGALFISSAAEQRPEPIFAGGAQERGFRPGTLPVPLIVGFGEAARLARTRMAADAKHARRLADHLLKGLRDRQITLSINGLYAPRLPGSLSLRLIGCDAASLINRVCSVVSIAEGSACTSGQISPSHVLTAMGQSAEAASETVRILCGRYNTPEEIDLVIDAIAAAIKAEGIARWTSSPVGSAHEGRAARF